VREFPTGATRDDDDEKLDFEGFISPAVLVRYGEYMHKHRMQSDDKLRPSDNWQKGIPIPEYAKSLVRHVVYLWRDHRVAMTSVPEKKHFSVMEEILCAIMFNTIGWLHELLKLKIEEFKVHPGTIQKHIPHDMV
jgi:hypothetical protein